MIKTVSLSCCKIIQNASVNKKKFKHILKWENYFWQFDKGKIQCIIFLFYSVIVNAKKCQTQFQCKNVGRFNGLFFIALMTTKITKVLLLLIIGWKKMQYEILATTFSK